MAKVTSFRVPQQQQSPPPYDFPQGFSGGMNISVSPDQIAPNCSPDMVNMNYDEGGVPSKRLGFKQFASMFESSPIRWMGEFKKANEVSEFLIIIGGKIYRRNVVS